MKVSVTLVALITGLLLAADEPQDSGRGKIRELHKERIATLTEYLEVKIKLRDEASASNEEVAHARVLVLNAELDACETNQDRIKIHEKLVEMLKDHEFTTETAFKSGICDYPSLIKAKADRIKAEIDLAQAKQQKD